MNNGVDWEEQWELFAQNYYDGKAHIDLTPYGVQLTLLLKAGPGFGDLSHPTTALMLALMRGRIEKQTVLDIGSGSGVLTLSALYLGAKKAYGIDIDPEAIEHAKRNAKLNHLEKKAHFSLEMPKLSQKSICLMNMILPEQRAFDPKSLAGKAKLWITSGILLEQAAEYLKQTEAWGWRLIEIRSQDQWLGAAFTPL